MAARSALSRLLALLRRQNSSHEHVQLLRMLQHRLRQCRSRSPALPARQRFLTLICSLVESDQLFFKVENNSLELTRIFKESFKDQRWAWEKSVRAEKRDRDAEREKETLTPKRLFLSLCISISLLRPYTFFSRSPLVFKTLSDQLWFQRRRRTKLRGIAQCPWSPMAGELVSFRHIVDGRTCLDWYVLNVGDEQSFFSIAEELCKTSAEEKRPPQFRFAISRKSGEEEDQAEWSLRCFVGMDRGGATVEVGGCLKLLLDCTTV